MSDHLSLDELADADVGLLDHDRVAAVEEHLAECAECRTQADAISQVSVQLAATPAPTMPADVFARLDAVLAQESQARARVPARSVHFLPARDHTTRPTLGMFGADLPHRAKARWLPPVLAAAAAAALVGFGGYVLSASAGLNEPPTVASAVNTRQLGSDARDLERDGLSPHRFSQAWQCARQVTSGRIIGLATTTVDGRPSLLVYTRSDGVTQVTVVTGCTTSPSAGPSAPLGR
ncbi:MAG TPA: zf-HC2 domain-containing protein [Propionibacteriaceae bacterium]